MSSRRAVMRKLAGPALTSMPSRCAFELVTDSSVTFWSGKELCFALLRELRKRAEPKESYK